MKLYIAGHQGMVGSALVRRFAPEPAITLLTRTRREMELTDQAAVDAFFASERPDVAIIAAAKVFRSREIDRVSNQDQAPKVAPRLPGLLQTSDLAHMRDSRRLANAARGRGAPDVNSRFRLSCRRRILELTRQPRSCGAGFLPA